MLQQVMTNPGEIIFREVPVPEIKDNQVLVKIMNIGICGSDIHVYHGKHPFTKYPVTQGHEVSGEVVKTGDAVTEFHVGQKVTIEPQVYCGHCYPCRHGKYNLCEELKVMGFQTTGTASEYFAVDASKVTPIPEDMSYEEGAMIEPLAVAVHGVKQMGDVTGMNIVVIGAGPIGNLVAQSAKGMGAAKVMITDVSDLRLEKAKECGIDVCVNTRNKNFGEAMVEAFGPDKADVIYDCAGNNITMGQAIKYARICPNWGVMNPNHYIAVCVEYLFGGNRPGWPVPLWQDCILHEIMTILLNYSFQFGNRVSWHLVSIGRQHDVT